MLENIPTQSTMTELLGQHLFEVWQELCPNKSGEWKVVNKVTRNE